MHFSRCLLTAALVAGLAALPAPSASAQSFGDLFGKAAKLVTRATATHQEQITTSLKDAVYGDPSRDGFTPPEAAQPLTTLRNPRNKGEFILRPGYYTMQVQSYCLHAGTHGPGKGEGYLYAPPKGPARDIIVAIARNSVQHPDIQQHDVQALIWAILARADFNNLTPDLQRVAAILLSSQQLAELMRATAFDMARERLLQELMDQASPQLRSVLAAEAQLRNMFTDGYSSFSELESAAVLAGMAPWGAGSMEIPEGRWSHHPDGYWVRYFPSSYSSTRLEIYVEANSTATGKTLDPALHIAVPGNTSRQRLLQSARSR